MSVVELRRQLGALEPVDERERDSIARTLERLDQPGNPFEEEASPLHLTASAFVVSRRGVILHRHRLLGIWVQPGGHVDEGETPEEACLRETLEETGLVARHREPAAIFHVDAHAGPKGHTHFDLRYVLLADPLDPSPDEGESPDVFWFDFATAQQRAESELVPVLAKLSREYDTWPVPDFDGE